MSLVVNIFYIDDESGQYIEAAIRAKSNSAGVIIS